MPRDVVMPLITVYSNRQRNQSFRAEAFAAGPDSNRAKIHCFHEAALTEREKGGHPATKTEPLQADPSPDGHPSIGSILARISKDNPSGKK